MSLSQGETADFSPEALNQLKLFCRQYLQLLDVQQITWPSSEYLRKANVQEWIYNKCFRDDEDVLPPERYRLRVLKSLLSKIENAIVDPEEDEISDDLMSTLPDLMFAPLPDETTAAQQKNWVTYTLISSSAQSIHQETGLKLLENRSVISGGGTTGLRTWEAALHLGAYLLSSPEASTLVKGKRVLELGAGTGLLGLMCAGHLGAKQVIATDGDEGVIEALKENASCNELVSQTAFRQLWWGRALKGSWLVQELASYDCDLVIGADVTYDKAVIPALVSTIRDLFELWPNVKVIISATIRNEDTFAAFEHVCERNEFSIQEIEFPLLPMSEQSLLFRSSAVPIKILNIGGPQHIKDPFAI